MNEDCGHINKVGGNIHVKLAKFFYVRQILSGDLGNRDVVDVDILLADKIKQQIQRPFVHAAKSDCKREVAGGFFRGRRLFREADLGRGNFPLRGYARRANRGRARRGIRQGSSRRGDPAVPARRHTGGGLLGEGPRLVPGLCLEQDSVGLNRR